MADMQAARDKLAAKFKGSRLGGKGTVRRKKKVSAKSSSTDDKKIGAALKKQGLTPLAGVEEVNMFQENGSVLHFASPKVQAAISANTFAISGKGEVKQIQELLPGIIPQLGPENIEKLKQLAAQMGLNPDGTPSGAGAEDEDDEMPDLVENFEDVSEQD